MSDTIGFVDMDNRRYSLVLPLVAVITPYMQAEATEKVVEVEQFNARIWRDADLKDITKKDNVLSVFVMIFQDSLREHYDIVRDKGKTSLLKTGADCQWQYYLTVYETIINELVKMVFNIKLKKDNVYYANRSADDIIECTSEGKNLYKDITCYDDSNWNYFFLINVLNQVKNGKAPIDEKLIENTYNKIIQSEKYKKYSVELEKASKDIRIYFDELELYDYLNRVNNLIHHEVKIPSRYDIGEQGPDNLNTITKKCKLFKQYKLYTRYIDDSSKWNGTYDCIITTNINNVIHNAKTKDKTKKKSADGIRYLQNKYKDYVDSKTLNREITIDEIAKIKEQATGNNNTMDCVVTQSLHIKEIKVLAQAISTDIRNTILWDVYEKLRQAELGKLTREGNAFLTFYDLNETALQLVRYSRRYIDMPCTKKIFSKIREKIANIIKHKEDFNTEHPILKEFYKAL